jgi:hypothetical protein
MSYEPDCVTDSRVFVNGTRLPAADVDVWLRKEGPLDMGRYAEAEFASPFRGEDFLQHFNSATPTEQDSPDDLRIGLHDPVVGRYVPVFRGIVTGVGNTADDDDAEQIWKARAQGPALLLNRIYFGKRYGEADMATVLEDAREELAPRVPFEVDIRGQENQPVQEYVVGEGLYDETNPNRYRAGLFASFSNPNIDTRKTFFGNKNTLADALNWASGKAGVFCWLEPTADGVAFVSTDNPTQQTHQAHYLDGNVGVIANDALSELKPINTLTLHGEAAKSLYEVGDFEINEPTDTFTKVKARHQPLYERAGGVEWEVGPITSSDAESKEEVVNAAKVALKTRIDETSGGDMECLLAAPVTPFDTIEARPTCREQDVAGTVPITYEIAQVHHRVRAGEFSKTTLNVGVEASMSDIEVVDSWQKVA